jgi:peptidoglycan L-alanyl-D-glutamate endopeptidase CwlK
MPLNTKDLRPSIKRAMNDLIAQCKAAGINIFVTQGVRTMDEQAAIYAQGRTTVGKIVSQAKPGYSPHNWGVAFDIAFKGAELYPALSDPLWSKVAAIAKKLGLEWGGDWSSFKDYPHFQDLKGYRMDYAKNDFQANKVDWTKWK